MILAFFLLFLLTCFPSLQSFLMCVLKNNNQKKKSLKHRLSEPVLATLLYLLCIFFLLLLPHNVITLKWHSLKRMIFSFFFPVRLASAFFFL